MNDFFKKGRVLFLAILSCAVIAIILIRYANLANTAIEKIIPRQTVIERGSIVDRSGKPLAVQTNFYHVGCTPHLLENKIEFAHDISAILFLNETDVLQLLQKNADANFVYLKKKIPQTQYEELKQIVDAKNYSSVRFDKIPGRVYPEGKLASQLVGYMGDDGKGLAGTEYALESELSPASNDETLRAGRNVFLTIDANLQYKLEEICESAMKETQAESMMLLACDAQSGELLSYISLPSIDLNEYGKAKPAEMVDRPAMEAYEPGSVFKLFTVAIAYDAGLLKANDSFFCDGQYEKRTASGERIVIKCLDKHGWLTARDALRLSCNDVVGQISDKITERYFIEKIKEFGFGNQTEIALPGETAGSVKEPQSKLWSARSKPTIAIGQEISVSALQMLSATTALANDGIPLKLTTIKKITNKDGSVFFEHKPEKKERIVSAETAHYLLSCMETTVTSGTGSRASLEDISIGVKTGTAQMADARGGYSETDFLSNCIAVFPIEKPEIILYIVIEKAKGETYAGRIVAPVIAKTADVIIDHLGMSRGGADSLFHSGKITIPKNANISIGTVMPDFRGFSKRELLPLLDDTRFIVKINGNGWVTSQSPAPGTPVMENMTIELNLE